MINEVNIHTATQICLKYMTLNVKVRNRISFYINYLHKLKIYRGGQKWINNNTK